MSVEYVSLTDVGRHRDHNEDEVGEPRERANIAPSRGWLFAVADGMGGHSSGEVASRIAIRTLFETYYASAESPGNALTAAVSAANAAVYDAGTAALLKRGWPADDARRMGTTLVTCVIAGQRVFGVSVGDSRAYLFREKSLTPLTHDQTFVAEQIRRGLITDEEAKHSRFRSVLLQALGQVAEIELDRFELSLAEGDVVLLCSDGLHGVVDDDAIERMLAEDSLEIAARRLIDAANANGGPDNISVILAKCV